MVNGNGIDPGIDDLLFVAKNIGISKSKADKIARNIRDCVMEMLGGYIQKR